MTGRLSVSHAIDGVWLAELAAKDPVEHAFAVWDLQHFADRIEFRVLQRDDRPVAYLLLWRGGKGAVSVHWAGATEGAEPLLAELPARPFVAILPDPFGPIAAERHGPAQLYGVSLRVCREPPPTTGAARRLVPSDSAELDQLARDYPQPLTSAYLGMPLDREYVAGVFEKERLVSVGRAQVRLPTVWMIGGIFTRPEARGRRYGRDVTALLANEAARTGAVTSLYVRDGNAPAEAIYDRLGFLPVGHRIWVDAGADWPA